MAHRLRRFRSRLWQFRYDTVLKLQERYGYACISGGTDCDGMEYAGVSFHWTRSSAQQSLDAGWDGAEGPYGGSVVSGAEGREWADSYEPDTRDRFAESMNY